MLRQGFLRLLPLSVLLLLLVQPLDPSSHTAGDTGTWDVPPEALEEQDAEAPLRDIMLVVEALPWLCSAVALMLRGIYLGWACVRRLRRRWAKEKSRSAGASAQPRCQGCGCSKELLQLLLENRALMKMCLRQSSRQRPVPRGKRRRNAGTQKRRVHFSPLLRLSSPSSSLGLVDLAGNV